MGGVGPNFIFLSHFSNTKTSEAELTKLVGLKTSKEIPAVFKFYDIFKIQFSKSERWSFKFNQITIALKIRGL